MNRGHSGTARATLSAMTRLRSQVLLLLALGGCGTAPVAPRPQDSPPATAAVRDGLGDDLDEQPSNAAVFANWDPFVDPDGDPVVYEWSIGTRPGATDVLEWSQVGGATHTSSGANTEVPLGVAVFVNVRATDLGGHRSAVSTSDGIVCGVTPHFTRTAPPAGAPGGAMERLAAIGQHGITWTFDRPMPCGRFANGDWWVVGPVAIVEIDPASVLDGARVRHGSMVNPDPRNPGQGYDNSVLTDGQSGRYDPALNVAFGISRSKPLTLATGTSLVSTISRPLAGELPQIETCAILTCLAEQPPPHAFRPPYCGTDKSCRRTTDQLDLARLGRLAPTATAPGLADLAERFARPWLDHIGGSGGRYVHPRANMPDYGRDLADLVGQAAVALQLDVDEATKRPLAENFVQLGIDVYGIVQAGGRFLADGGSGSGRKFPMLFAGAVLVDSDLLACARDQHAAFAEDVQTFHVAETSSGIWNRGCGGYGPEDSGLPEWGHRHADDPRYDNKSWTGDPYRRCCTANVWLGYVLAARIMGLRQAWNHDPLFDYVDRYVQVERVGDWRRSWNPWVEQMWDRYRAEL